MCKDAFDLLVISRGLLDNLNISYDFEKKSEESYS